MGHRSYMESLQCLEAFSDHVISLDMCYPSSETISNQTNEMLAIYHIKDVYIATDDINAYAKLQLNFDSQVYSCHGNMFGIT